MCLNCLNFQVNHQGRAAQTPLESGRTRRRLSASVQAQGGANVHIRDKSSKDRLLTLIRHSRTDRQSGYLAENLEDPPRIVSGIMLPGANCPE